MSYHDRKFRDWLVYPFYKIPTLPIPLERLLLKLINKIEGERPYWLHLGKDCPCL